MKMRHLSIFPPVSEFEKSHFRDVMEKWCSQIKFQCAAIFMLQNKSSFLRYYVRTIIINFKMFFFLTESMRDKTIYGKLKQWKYYMRCKKVSFKINLNITHKEKNKFAIK